MATNQPRLYHYLTDIYTSKFENAELANELKAEYLKANERRIAQPNLYRFIKSYQEHGYKKSTLDPLNQQKNEQEQVLSELDPTFYGLTRGDANKYSVEGLLNANSSMTVEDLENYLKKVYSNSMTIEFEFLQSEEEKLWIAK